MKQYTDVILHGASLFRQLKAGHPHGSHAAVSIAAAQSGSRTLKERAGAEEGEGDDFFSSLVALGVGGGDESASDDLFSMLGGVEGGGGDDLFSSLAALGIGGGDESAGDDLFSVLGEANEYLEQCGIDVSDMTNKAIGAYFLYGPGLNFDSLSNFDPDSPGSLPDFDSLPSFQDMAPMLLAFKDDDEESCTSEDNDQQVLASKNYLQCSGLTEKVIDLGSDLDLELQATLQNVEDDCKPAFDSLLSLQGDLPEDLDEDSDLGKSTRMCLQSVLGDNPIGNLIRHEYKNLDKVLRCTKNYSNEMPRCIMNAPIEDGTAISLPLSLYKKFCCLVGATSDIMIEGVCTGLYEILDEDLPQAVAANQEYAYDPHEGQFLGIDISIITGDELPTYCSKVYEEQGVDGAALQSRFDQYNAQREHGWTIETSSMKSQAEAKIPVVSLAASKRAEAEIPAVSSSWDNDSKTNKTASAKTKVALLIGGGVGFAILALAAVAFYLKPKAKAERPGYLHVSRAFEIL